jgi:hypothetical protein
MSERIWATEEEAREEFRSRTFPGPSPLKEMQVKYYVERSTRMDYDAAIDAADQERKARKENPRLPLFDSRNPELAEKAKRMYGGEPQKPNPCGHYGYVTRKIEGQEDKPVCLYCGEELEL